MIKYKSFWETLKAKNVSTYALINQHGISSSTIDRLRKGESVTTTTLDKLCDVLDCQLDDIIDYIKEPAYYQPLPEH